MSVTEIIKDLWYCITGYSVTPYTKNSSMLETIERWNDTDYLSYKEPSITERLRNLINLKGN